MDYPLRHSHIAIRTTLACLAEAACATISAGDDEFGRYHFFDLMVAEGEGPQRVRFATHPGDAMVHLLAERISDLETLSSALRLVGVDAQADLSVSRDQDGRPLRDIAALKASLKSTEPPLSPFSTAMH